MLGRISRWSALLWLALFVAAAMGACSSSNHVASSGHHGGDAGPDALMLLDGGNGEAAQGFDVQPATLQTITVNAGQNTPTVKFTATSNGNPVSVAWSVDRGSIGSVPVTPASSAVFTPTGKVGGLVTVTAGYNGKTLDRKVMVKIVGQQNGADANNADEAKQIASSVGQLTAGGGIGGVGGEGLGGKVTDAGILAQFKNPAGNGQTQGLHFLYPYDKTVFPRGILAPLLMWDWSIGDADAVQIQLSTTSGSFSWTGTFAKPAILQQTGGKFIRHPIPQDVWAMATDSAGGATLSGAPDQLTVKLWVDQGGSAYGPISETWTIAPARLSGIIYYGSYGTNLAKNFTGAVGGDGKFGGAVLSIHVGDTVPQLVAGASGTTADCRVCHSVSADGSRLIAQHGDNYDASSAYDLSPTGNTEHALSKGARFPAVYPDGSMMLSPGGQLLPLPNDATPIAVSGLSSVSTDLGTPAFSPDGKRVAFNPTAGPGVTDPTQKLLVMGFDNATDAFSNPVVVADFSAQPAAERPGWPAFLPDGNSIVFHKQVAVDANNTTRGDLLTRAGAKAQIAWTSSSSNNVAVLNELNGLNASGSSYLPKLAAPKNMSCTAEGTVQVGSVDADHGDDQDLNYEPTVNPVASGGYVWVVFTSRRLYGNVATIPPFCSDPRGVDLVKNITTKKLWVSALDLSGKPGTDPSHPAFYLPAQELLAGNMRAFWVLDPCRADGQTCESGDQCCNGYCEPGSGGALTCTKNKPNNKCSGLQEKCTSPADCCDSTNLCINGFCSQHGPT